VFTLPAPLRYRDYRAYWVSRFLTTIAGQMLVIVIGWQVYDIARETRSQGDSAFLLGMIGLVQFVPMFALTLVVGVIADRVDRRHIARAAIALQFLCAALLAWLSLCHQVTLPALFVIAFLMGFGRAFAGPSLSALAPNLVPREILPAAIALSAISWQTGAVIGPPLGAFLYALDPASPYLIAALLFFGALAGCVALLSAALAAPLVGTFLQTGLVPRLPTAVLCTGLMLVAGLLCACGLILDSLARSRIEQKRMFYLALARNEMR
jgi:MFS family permease